MQSLHVCLLRGKAAIAPEMLVIIFFFVLLLLVRPDFNLPRGMSWAGKHCLYQAKWRKQTV